MRWSQMDFLFRRLVHCALHPVQGFQERAAESPKLGVSFGWMLLLRGSISLIGSLLTLHAVYRDYPAFKDPHSRMWQQILQLFPAEINVEDVRAFVTSLPDLPSWANLWPWMIVLPPVGIASAWLHNAVWDHMSLWMLGGVKRTGNWRSTFIAEAEAMQVGALDAAIGLLGFIPLMGLLLTPVFMVSGAYFWMLRGLALAAFHRAPMWKGVAATLLHIILAIIFVLGMLGISLLIVMQSVSG
ncbi:MAG: hypothetical protein IPP78_15035 [Holophagaceae bacterium]|nr:hypothetical protein [Holophagaceae bacterium]